MKLVSRSKCMQCCKKFAHKSSAYYVPILYATKIGQSLNALYSSEAKPKMVVFALHPGQFIEQWSAEHSMIEKSQAQHSVSDRKSTDDSRRLRLPDRVRFWTLPNPFPDHLRLLQSYHFSSHLHKGVKHKKCRYDMEFFPEIRTRKSSHEMCYTFKFRNFNFAPTDEKNEFVKQSNRLAGQFLIQNLVI